LRDVWCASPALWRRFPPVGFIRSCEPALVARPPVGPGWLHEIKHDGFRIVTLKQGETWAMMLLGFVGLGFAGYRHARRAGAASA
jgi:hypothetical protein